MPVTFSALWDNHPSNLDADNEPCKTPAGEPAFENQCAIRMGVTLTRCGYTVTGITRCWLHPASEGHKLRAQEVANWIKARPTEFGAVAIKKKADGVTKADYAGKTGLIFFMNFWGTGMQGDHVDVWNGSKQASYISHPDPLAGDDYFERAQEVWFWEIA